MVNLQEWIYQVCGVFGGGGVEGGGCPGRKAQYICVHVPLFPSV